jgi:hypothetical protein
MTSLSFRAVFVANSLTSKKSSRFSDGIFKGFIMAVPLIIEIWFFFLKVWEIRSLNKISVQRVLYTISKRLPESDL